MLCPRLPLRTSCSGPDAPELFYQPTALNCSSGSRTRSRNSASSLTESWPAAIAMLRTNDLLLSGRLENQIRDRVGLRYEGNMARFDLDRFRAHAFRHEAFQIRIDRPVFRGHSVPARLRSPCRVGCLIGKQRPFERGLNSIENTRLIGGHVAGEVAQECLLTQPSIVAGPDNAGGGRRCWKPARERRVVLARIGCARCDVNESRNLGIDTGLGDDHAGERMARQHSPTLLQSQGVLRCLDSCL